MQALNFPCRPTAKGMGFGNWICVISLAGIALTGCAQKKAPLWAALE
jgi:hypothetical protein